MNNLGIYVAIVVIITLLLGTQFSHAKEVDTSVVLKEYLEKPDDSYRWKKVREGKVGETEYAELILQSQTWRGIPWKHQLWVIKPPKISKNQQALLYIGGGRWQEELEDPNFKPQISGVATLLADLARRLESPIAILLHVPQQPIFDGKMEDQIISYTFQQFLQTKETDWPLLLPMVKSAVRAMDATQKFCQEQWQLPVESFTVTGASKRGWTTWLVGAHDKRVNAIAPMVIDVLNMAPQMDYQLETWGNYSERIGDYTERGLQKVLKTPSGQKLASIVDPYSYRDSLALTKVIINGTNDRFWPVDALNLYWDDLPGKKYALYVPNEGHGIRDYPRLLGALVALHRHASGVEPLPQPEWKIADNGDSVSIAVTSDKSMQTCQLWTASSDTKDFRDATWKAEQVEKGTSASRFEIEKPVTGYRAFFAEMLYDAKDFPLHLSTNLRVLGGEEAGGK